MSASSDVLHFGLIVIGDEVLNGTAVDGHFQAIRKMLFERGHDLAWFRILPDDHDILVAQLREAMADTCPVLSCGGIGATPDDLTRACVAEALDVPLEIHPEGKAILQYRFGDELTPERLELVNFPADARLIPNPYNQIPGFSVGNNWFTPGFPQMAHPMLAWVLDQHYVPSTAKMQEFEVRIEHVNESQLIPVMKALGNAFPAIKFFSLPHIEDQPWIEFGCRAHLDISAPARALLETLDAYGISYRRL